ncbi:MAG: hypothetical protein Hens2KO_21600 [Henriciella sp.]
MTQIDPIIPQLLDIKHKDQVQRLSALMTELRGVEQKRAELAQEFEQLDQRQDGYTQISIANGYLRYMQHRQETLDRQISKLKDAVDAIQDDLRQTVFSQSVLKNS